MTHQPASTNTNNEGTTMPTQEQLITAAWQQLATSGVPPSPRYGSYGVYDAANDRLVVFGGGYPVVVDGAVVGGIGVSGGHYSEDQEVAEAGLAILG